MIKYRPHRFLLDESMDEMRIFNTIDEMFEFIVKDWSGCFDKGDLSISEDFGKDNRIDWKETRHVCTKRVCSEMYEIPQCIGMCSIEGE